ncbi:universal stress protein [Microscilla marina]|uniref:Universal stress protein family n=1 Tax=Microscilla marina ATCC 23134 TaxID=313606 RepID=A1ZRP4_MICM2|nr:universal stress protein [Microscilla marina]EAY26949.1 universal stress protein family [Microscilla marina ATCC 23134]
MKILVPYDFSEQSQNALEVAFSLANQSAKKNEVSIVLFHVIEPLMAEGSIHPDFRVDYSQVEHFNRMVKATKAELENIAGSAQYAGIEIDVLVETGNFLQQAKHHATKENDVRLIVAGTSGASGLEEVLTGSNTEKLVRHMTCPVLAIPQKVENFEVKSVLFATNLEEEQFIALNRLQQLQVFWGNHIHLLYINTPNNFLTSKELNKRKEEFVYKSRLKNYTFHTYSDKNEEIGVLNASKEIDADVVVIPTNQRKGLWHFFMGSIAEGVVNHSDKPVLTVNLKLGYI